VRSFVIGSGMLAFYGAFGATLIILISLYCNKNSYPLNAYLLAAFTFFESWLVGTICAMYQQQGLECAAQVLKSSLCGDVDFVCSRRTRPLNFHNF
jgi:FtsH-binding integral membrane protein